uniref:FAD-binding protein n=1 Tax=Volvariella volvacea TaxID=36659 RepID=M9ZBQ0_9AGAR|nr:FAD-binding protein [Volvariella volvacea]AGK29880.1 FAD-binding protein [Volvariella volvacea]
MRLPLIVAVAAAIAHARPRPPPSQTNCCALLEDIYPDKVSYPGDATYVQETQNYWSSTCVLSPTCFFTPDVTAEVATAVKLFTENNCKFSVRAGGHHSSVGAASNEGGPVIALTNFKQKDVDPVNNIVSVGPGNRFHEVYTATDAYNKVAVLGRYAQVGTGLLLGAGLSYLNNPEGLSVDNVVAHEVVLANGTVVVASRDNYPDLHKALKGGGDNFGVVTRYDLKIFDYPENVLGGLVTYGEEAMPFYDDLTYNYHVDAAVNDKSTHILPQWGYNGATRQRESFTPFIYLKDQPQLPPSLQPWVDVPWVHNTIRNTSALAPLSFENHDGYVNGDAQQQRTITVYADRAFFKEISRLYYEFAQRWAHIDGFYALHCKMPITPFMVEKGIENGGNVLGLEGIRRPVSILYFGVQAANIEDAPELFKAQERFVENLRDLARRRGLLHKYIMWNYAAYNQKVIDSYGPGNVAFLKRVSRKYDPTGAFQRLVGGQKIPN